MKGKKIWFVTVGLDPPSTNRQIGWCCADIIARIWSGFGARIAVMLSVEAGEIELGITGGRRESGCFMSTSINLRAVLCFLR